MKSYMLVALAAAVAAEIAQAQKSSGSWFPNAVERVHEDNSSRTACTDVHYIVVRASTEPPGPGVIGSLATMSASSQSDVSTEALDYPAVLQPYASSSYNGTMALTSRLKSYVDSCARAKIVLLGYSQGAHVIGDVLCGGGGSPGIGPASPPIEDKYGEKVAAVVQMGDPRFMAKKAFDGGNSTLDGIFPRPANISCDKYASKIKSYCDADDLFCASGQSLEVHLGYTRRYNKDANDFIAEKLKQSSSGSGGGSSGSTSGAPSQFASHGLASLWAFAFVVGSCILSL